MGNQFEVTKQVSISSQYWLTKNSRQIATVATRSLIETAHSVVNTAVAPYVPPSYNKIKVPQNISPINDQNAVHITIFAVWIRDGSLSGPLSTITGLATGTALTHWFAQIQTNNPNVWYWAELNNHGLTLKSCSSPEEVKKHGAESCCNHNAEKFSPKMQKSCYRSLKEVKQWTQKSNHQYHLTLHNCQHWARQLFEWI